MEEELGIKPKARSNALQAAAKTPRSGAGLKTNIVDTKTIDVVGLR